jgi:hypothetical protein
MPFPKPLNVDWELVRKALIDEGKSYKEVQKQFGISAGSICFHAAKEGWNISQHRKALALVKATTDGKYLRAPSGHLLLARGTQAVLHQFKCNDFSSRHALSVAIRKATRQLQFMPGSWIIEHARDLKCVTESAALLFNWGDAKRRQNGSHNADSKADLFKLTPDQLAKLAAVEIDANPTASLD